jgi:hypothetical protein
VETEPAGRASRVEESKLPKDEATNSFVHILLSEYLEMLRISKAAFLVVRRDLISG